MPDYAIPYNMDTNRIRDLRKLRKLTLEKVAEQAGTSAQQISRLEKGDIKLSLNWMKRISAVLGVSPAELIDGDIGPWNLQADTKSIKVIGQVQAGVWREALEWAEDERYSIASTIQSAEHAAHCYGLVVNGDSMDKVYPEGTILIVMPIDKYPYKVENGDNVIVRRTRAGVMEATVKELQIKKGRAELCPRSSNPKYLEPINIHWPNVSIHQSDIETVEITAIVVGSYKVEKKL